MGHDPLAINIYPLKLYRLFRTGQTEEPQRKPSPETNLPSIIITVKIQENEPTTIKYMDSEEVTGVMIGKTNEVIFLLRNEQVTAVPLGSMIKEFDVK